MKDSGIEWIGEMPVNWQIRRLKHAFREHAGGNWGSNEGDSENDTICVRVADFDYLHLSVNFHEQMTTRSYSAKTIRDCLLQPGDILLEKSGGGETTPVGRSVLFSSNERMTCANFIEFLRPNEQYDSSFLAYWLSAAYINGLTKRNIKQTTGIQNLDIPAFMSEYIVYTDINTQKRIAGFLDNKCSEVDVLIATKERTNALLIEHRQSIIYEAVTKGLNPDVPMKDSGVGWIGEIPEEWSIVPLKRYAAIRTGFTLGKRYEGNKELREYPYLRVANVQGEYTDLSDITTTQMPPAEAEQYFLHPGELLMTEGGDRDKLGRGSAWHGEIANCLHQNHVFALATKDGLNVEYLSYLTTSDVGRSYFDYTANKTTNLASTNATTILNFRIPLPSRSEQDEIVEYLNHACSQIDSALSVNETIIRQLKEYRQSVIYEAVTGKIEA